MGHMSSKELLDISGKPLVMLGGEYVAIRHVSHGIVTEFTWHDGQPCMYIFKDGRTGKQGAYRIDLKDTFHYADSRGNPSTMLFTHAIEAAQAIGFDRNDRNAIRVVMDRILDDIPDLVEKMPPCPAELDRRENEGSSELLVTLNGKSIFEGMI
jgi:hypothetical protein